MYEVVECTKAAEKRAVSENVYAGTDMERQAINAVRLLNRGKTGSLSIGIGMVRSKIVVSYISPNDIVIKTGEQRVIDGVKMECQMTPGTEAPVNLNPLSHNDSAKEPGWSRRRIKS